VDWGLWGGLERLRFEAMNSMCLRVFLIGFFEIEEFVESDGVYVV